MNNVIEFRKDLVSGDWVLISGQKSKKPVFFTREPSKALPKSRCPFENIVQSEQGKNLLWLPKKGKSDVKDWWVRVYMNKYPVVVTNKTCSPTITEGLFRHTPGNGFQELVIMRDHVRSFGLMTKDEIKIILESYIFRYRALSDEPCVEFILILHNSGPRAGASVPHPHSQIFALPIIPPDVSRSLEGSKRYFEKTKRCVHCDILKSEINEKTRIIYQNSSFVAVAPYASKVSYETRIFPKKHEPRFEIIDQQCKNDLADAMRVILSKIYKNLKNPDYNFFIHTSPPGTKHDKHYHWHMEILPRIAIWGGLELGAGIDVVRVSPEEAAKLLRKS
ncbi:MAG: HIT domain-containing protein [bacterium]|nr:HIT domain-containing protein [bacterium]